MSLADSIVNVNTSLTAFVYAYCIVDGQIIQQNDGGKVGIVAKYLQFVVLSTRDKKKAVNY